MKSDERHRLKENIVLKYVKKAMEWIIPNAGKIVTGIVVILLIIVGTWYINYKKDQKNIEAGVEISKTMNDLGVQNVKNVSEDKISVLEDLINNYKTTNNGAILSYKIGRYYFNKDSYDKALNYLNIAKNNLDDSDFIKHMVANIFIEQQKYEKALTELQSIKKEYELYDNILYLMYLTADRTNKEKIVANVKKEFEKDEYKNSKYYNMLKIREAL